MAYKSVKKRVRRTEDTFTMGDTTEKRQKNGVIHTVTKAVRDDGLIKRDILIFANGGRVDRIRAALERGKTSRLVGKYSQPTVFVALDQAAA